MKSQLNARLETGKPIRPIKPSQRSLTGRVVVQGQAIAYESSLERAFLLGLSFDPSVQKVREQPLRLYYQDAAQKRRYYTPDFLVEYRNGRRILYEIK